MLEQRRQQYLSLLGVENYVPRRLLSAAAASQLLTHEQIAEANKEAAQQVDVPVINVECDEAIDEAIKEKDIQKQASISSIIELDNTSKKDLSQESSGPEKAVDEVVSPANVKELNFVLTVWRIHDQLLVIDSREPGAAYPTDRLLQNMLRAIGYPLAQLPASDIIRWPVFTSNKRMTKSLAQQNQDLEQAMAMVQAYISAQLSRLPVKAMLCMGENAARFSLGIESENGEALENKTESTSWDIPVAVTPSLFQMLQDPMLKAKAWVALQSISVKG